MNNLGISHYVLTLRRVCETCGRSYTIDEFLKSSGHYFQRPHVYREGCERCCLPCWLGVGPLDFPDEYGRDTSKHALDVELRFQIPVTLPRNDRYDWPFENAYEKLATGNILEGFAWFLARGFKLAVLPISRLHVNCPAFLPGGISFYPPGMIPLNDLSVTSDREDSDSPAERSSLISGVTLDLLGSLSLVVVPCRFDWAAFRQAGHEEHMELIRQLSEGIDHACLDFVRYRLCRIEPIEGLPGHAGQIEGDPTIAGALVYSHENREARTIGGTAFSHVMTRGLGLTMRQLEWNDFPADGEIGHIVQHALSLYAALLEANNHTARFMQALSLLEFLAYPNEYKKFEEVKKVIARHVARDATQYHKLLERFKVLTGKKDPDTGREIGYRTRIVHMGERIEKLIPDVNVRRQLFSELDSYIRPVIDHMIDHSEKRL